MLTLKQTYQVYQTLKISNMKMAKSVFKNLKHGYSRKSSLTVYTSNYRI